MTTSGNQHPQRVQDHLERYLATGGRDGHIWNGVPTLLLTTTGMQSGEPFTTPLVYGRKGGDYMVVASRGGAVRHPAWYRNLRANPTVEVQVAAGRFTATARTASPEERARLWPVMTAIWPRYDEYQEISIREIPLVILEPKQETTTQGG